MMDANFIWPTREDYEFSMKNLDSMAHDARIRAGRVKVDQFNNISKVGGAGLYTSTFQITAANERHRYSRSLSSDWMVRCFCTTPRGKPPTDIGERYQKISTFCRDYLEKHDEVTAPLLPIEYVEQAIKVYYLDDAGSLTPRGISVPVVKMPFIEARSLGDFIATKYEQSESMKQLCIAWLNMIKELEGAHFAHGDLDLTNVLVLENDSQLILKLIDYDNVWIPELAGRPNPERGHRPFQHPMFFAPTDLPRPYNAEMDRFSAFSIYISIRAIGLRPQLYKDFGADETNRLLFSAEDYRKMIDAPQESRIVQLLHMDIKEIKSYLHEFIINLRDDKPEHILCSLDAVPLLPDQIIAWNPTDRLPGAVQPSIDSSDTTHPSTALPGGGPAQTPYQQPSQQYQPQFWPAASESEIQKANVVAPQQYQPQYWPAARKSLLKSKTFWLWAIFVLLVIAVIIAFAVYNHNHSSTPAYLPLRYLVARLPTTAHTIMDGGV